VKLTVRATNVTKYSLASATCQPIWLNLVGELDLFLTVAKDCGIVVYLNQSQQSSSPCFGLSANHGVSAICVGSCRWISLAAACADPVLRAAKYEGFKVLYFI